MAVGSVTVVPSECPQEVALAEQSQVCSGRGGCSQGSASPLLLWAVTLLSFGVTALDSARELTKHGFEPELSMLSSVAELSLAHGGLQQQLQKPLAKAQP